MTLHEFIDEFGPALRIQDGPARELVKLMAPKQELGLAATRRGPGSTVQAAPANVAAFALALLAGGPQTKAAETVWKAWSLQAEGRDAGAAEIGSELPDPSTVRCDITDQWTFGDAVKAILSDPALADEILRVELVRGASDASIVTRDFPDEPQRFGPKYDAERPVAGLRVAASIDGGTLAEMARAIVS